jgi:beta-lactamase superfamily II metal-dependent hydrolase
MLILTHPHDDHVAGFDRLVTRYASGPVGAVGVHLARHGFTESDDAARVLATGNRLKALAAIHHYWREHPEHKWVLTADGKSRPLGPAEIEVLHPDQAYLDAGEVDPTDAPNAYSTPVLVTWGAARIVLGADLPTAEWEAVLQAGHDPHLAEHGALKVSHHGSMGSRADDLVRASSRDASAAITPWQLGRGLLPKRLWGPSWPSYAKRLSRPGPWPLAPGQQAFDPSSG